jgi:transposase
MKDITWVGLDVHKDMTFFAILRPGESVPIEGELKTCPTLILKMLRKNAKPSDLRVCYEAGPCGFDLWRSLDKAGVHCDVIAPSLIPVRAGERIKTDRRDAVKLARLYRAGELTAVRVPTPEEEAVRDLCRCRERTKEDLTRARHRLSKFLLRHGRIFREGKAWTKRHWTWVKAQSFEDTNLTATVNAYILHTEQAMENLRMLDSELDRVAESDGWKERVSRLTAFRGIARLTALVLLAEIGDFTRFANPKSLMAYLGLVPSEYSSGARRRQGSITKTGNSHARRVLVEAAWKYQYRPSMQGALKKRLEGQSKEVVEHSRKTQERLYRRYRSLVSRGKRSTVATVAVARELAGFIWSMMTKSELAA